MNPILYCHLLIFRIRLSAGFELEPAHPPHYLTEFPSRFLQASQLIVELGLQAGQPGPFKTATAAPTTTTTATRRAVPLHLLLTRCRRGDGGWRRCGQGFLRGARAGNNEPQPACRSDSITGATATAGGLAFAAGPSIVADN